MKRLLILFTLCLTLFASQSFAQESNCNNNLDDDNDGLVDCRDGDCATKPQPCEICDNGIDDDGDFFIDCYDKECTIDAACKGFFLGKVDSCSVKPTVFPAFEMKLKYESEPSRANHVNRLIVGDVDNDGTPEIVTTYRSGDTNAATAEINILQAPGTATGTLFREKFIDTKAVGGVQPTFEDIAMADIDKDGYAELFILTSTSDGNNYKIVAYSAKTGLTIWPSPISYTGTNYPGTMGLADFDGDGAVELYVRTQVYDAHSGTLMGQNLFNNDLSQNSNGPIAADMLDDHDGLELVAGCRIYSVAINRPSLPPAIPPVSGSVVTLEEERTEYFTRRARVSGSATSVADFDQDGYLDVLAVGSTINDPDNTDQNTTIFFWDVHNDVLKTFIETGPGDYARGWKNGAGRINIADIDGDTLMNAVYVSGKYMYALEEGPTSLVRTWRENVIEETSGYTGCTMFDFNADGKSEIVYRDEENLYIFTTQPNKTVVRSNPVRCASRTSNEYPIVADMNGDGSTEICVACSTTNTILGKNLSLWDEAVVRVFESANVPWVPARKVWNQHGYFVVNVNDDLTIPRQQQLHHLIYSKNAECRDFGTSRPLNSFLNQSPYLNSFGCPSFPRPNLSVLPYDANNAVSYIAPICPVDSFQLSFKFMNRGDIGISGNVKVSFYNGDPRPASPLATRLATKVFSMSELNPGDTVTMSTWVKGPGSTFRLFIVLNDNGTTIPLDVLKQLDRIIECDYDNIIDATIRPERAPLTAELIRDNFKCSLGAADNGAVRAYVPMGAIKDSVNFTFYWSKGTVAKPIGSTDHVGPSYAGVGAGTYTVYAMHKVAACSTVVADVDVTQTINLPVAKVTKLRDNDSCDNPNGGLKVVVNDTDNDGVGDPVGNFNYSWYTGSTAGLGDTLSISHSINGLKSGSYSVYVQNKATGCVAQASGDIVDLAPIPKIDTAHTDIKCDNLPTGSVSAWIKGPPITTTGYTFYWSDGNIAKPTEDFKGPDYNARPAGTYTVFAEHNSSKCRTDTITLRVKQTPPIVVSIIASTPQTSCDTNLPNGTASAAVSGMTAGYTWEWFRGQNTLTQNLVGTNPSITGLMRTTYTVRATNANGCSDTEEVSIGMGVVPVNLVLSSKTNASVCTPPNGSITVSVSPGLPADYKFKWYIGSTVKTVSDFPNDTLQTLTGLAPGNYTVVATYRSRHCTTNPITVNITNISPPIAFGLVTKVEPSDCNDNHGNLSIPLSATGNTLGFKVEWYRGARPFAAPPFLTETVMATTFADDLSAGSYTVVVENLNTHCVTEQRFPLNYQGAQILSFVDKDPVNTCDPANEGRIRVRLIPPTGSGFVEADYTIFVYAGANDPEFIGMPLPHPLLATIPGVTGTAIYTYGPPAGIGEYTFVAVNTKPGIPGVTGCRSTPVIEEIVEVTENPSFTAATPTMNMNCAGTTGTGQIILSLTGPTTDPDDYDFNWFEGTSTSGAILGTTVIGAAEGGTNGERAVNLKAGFYTVQVIKKLTTGSNAGCDTTATYQVFDNPPILTLSQADLTLQSVTRCDQPTMGTATVNSVSENGVSIPVVVAPPNYTFEWFSENPVPGGPPVLIPAATTNILSGLTPGKYYVQPTGATNMCSTSEVIEFIIENDTINTVQVALNDFTVPTLCLKPTNVGGELFVTASGNSTLPVPYTYSWYEGTDTSVPLGTTVGNVSGAAGENAINLIGGFYTVRVLNNETFCTVKETYQLPYDTAVIALMASSSPMTFCTLPSDGAAYAIVTSADHTLYSYEWYAGTATIPPVASPPPILPEGRSLPNQPAGVYLIVATDTDPAANPICFATDTVTIDDIRVIPTVTAVPLNPLTNCDDTKPNGTASASVEGNTIDYAFDWFRLTNPADTMAVGSQVSNLADSTYTVIASHRVTGCSDETTVTIGFMPVAIKNPAILILSHVTSCVENNGALSVSVEGNIMDYVFEWYIGTTAKPSPDYVGDYLDSLAVGTYSVRATSKITGCVSPLASAELLSLPVYPEFKIEVKPSPCDEDGGEIYMTITNGIMIDSIIWEGPNGQVLNDPVLQGIPAGHYTVTVFSLLGCSASQEVDVPSEIHPFNGISRNGDGQNDYFHINCIGEFPDNIVRIFNRAGTMVYEEEGYDNLDLYFDGRSNKGVSLMGTNLPDGTYFYVIDKRNGSKPIAGYLEIVN